MRRVSFFAYDRGGRERGGRRRVRRMVFFTTHYGRAMLKSFRNQWFWYDFGIGARRPRRCALYLIFCNGKPPVDDSPGASGASGASGEESEMVPGGVVGGLTSRRG